MKKLIVLIAFLSLSCSGDDDNDEVMCTEEARAGLMVTVKDAMNGTFLTEGVTVTAVDGNYTEELTNVSEFTQEFIGAYERAGNYTITVTKQGYVTQVTLVIEVGEDICHVIGESVLVELQPED